MLPARRKIRSLEETLDQIQRHFEELQPFELIFSLEDQVIKKVEDAVWTFQRRVKDRLEDELDLESAIKSCGKGVVHQLGEDSLNALPRSFSSILEEVLMPTLEEAVFSKVETILALLTDTLHEELKEFVDVYAIFKDLLRFMLKETIDLVIKA